MRGVVGDTERMRSAQLLAFIAVLAFAGLAGCSTYRDQLARSERAFEKNEADKTLAILRDLEPNFQRLTPNEQATYAYVRGMTDLSLGYKADARHWLAVANAYEQVTPGALPGDRKTKTTEALKELNDVVYMKGTSELVNATPPAADSAAPASPPAKSDKGDGKKKEKPKAPAADDASDQD